MSHAFKAGFLMAGEGSAESAAVNASGSDPGQWCEVLGMPQAVAVFSAGCPCVRGDLVLSLVQTSSISAW